MSYKQEKKPQLKTSKNPVPLQSEELWISAKSPTTREELERIVRKEKIDSLAAWLVQHFTCDRNEYREKSPLLILKGPSGCGKTTTLQFIAKELGLPIKEFDETVNDNSLYQPPKLRESPPTSFDFAKIQAGKFEQFVTNHLKFASLDDMESPNSTTDTTTRTLPKLSPADGVIILVETPLSIARSSNILIDTMFRLRNTIKQYARCIRRRAAIVFETLENDAHLLMPVKTKQQLQMDSITFNPVTKTNLVKFVKSFIGERALDKDQMDTVIAHCDGDVRACINSLQIMFEHKIDLGDCHFAHPSKAKRMKHEFTLNKSMLKGENLQVNFFHVLGKIFYQKRLYPDYTRYQPPPEKHRSVERPYPTENSSNSLLEMLDVSPETLISWLYHNYAKFCCDQDILKASHFLENLSTADMTSLDMLQSTQFYESHYSCDQIQSIISIEGTTYSLYTNNLDKDVSNDYKKKSIVNGETKIIKSSVTTNPYHNSSDNTNDGKRSFNKINFEKPPFHQLRKLIESFECIVECCSTELTIIDRQKICVDYMPYGSSINSSHGSYGEICGKYNEFKLGRSMGDYETLELDLKKIINTYAHNVTKDLLDDEINFTDGPDDFFIDEAPIPV